MKNIQDRFQVSPQISVLRREQIMEVHNYSSKILQETGIQVESKTALEIFKKSDGVQIKNNVVFIQNELVEYAINKAPSNIEVFAKSGETAFHLGEKQGNTTHFGIGVTNTWFQNIDTNEVEKFTRKHMQYSTQLGHLLPNFDMISTLGISSDVPADKSDLYAALDMYANTSKPLVLLISGENQMNKVFDLLSFLHGNISEKPFCIPYVNPITPLVLNKSTSDKMIATINAGLPLMYSNYSMYGGTTPITAAGSLALLNAELLAGLVFSQLIKEGSEIILGSLPAAFNLATMGSQYTSTSYLLNIACAEMMNFYQIPHCGTSGSNNGRGPDLLASADLWQNHLSSCLGKVGCAPFVGGNFDSMAFSPTTVVLANHIIGETRKFAKGFNLHEKEVNLEEIKNVGHRGNYFTSEQTLAALPDMDSANAIWSSMSLEDWQAKNMPTAEKDLIETTKKWFEEAKEKSKLSSELVKKGEEFIQNNI